MPDEDMELISDYLGPTEDIDIDVEFATAQPDDDMELGDLDKNGYTQNLASDTQDELMAEGEDASYGMIDADEIDYNEDTLPIDDFEAEPAGASTDTWQPVSSATNHIEGQVDEIDYAHTIDGNVPAPEHSSNNGEHRHEDILSSDELAVSFEQTAAEQFHHDAVASELPSDAHSLLETFASTQADSTLDDEHAVVHTTESGAKLNTAGFQQQQDSPHEGPGTPHSLGVEEPAGTEPINQEHSEAASDEISNAGGLVDVHEEQEKTEHVEQKNDIHGRSAGLGADDGADEQTAVIPVPPAVHQDSAITAHFPTESHEIEEHHVDQNAHANSDKREEIEAQSYTDDPKNQGNPTKAPLQNTVPSVDVTGSSSLAEVEHAEVVSSNHDDGQGSSVLVKDPLAEHPASIATRYEILISYGRTDYRLFAKSENDDPNQYFLNDVTSLEQPLAIFLSNLRDVISQEVSPLDELVLHVDGLGLEFGESMANDFLEKYTFGDILTLFDTLAKHDKPEVPPDLYCYLMIRPSCSQRLAALVDQANAGRGLKDVAVYREATPTLNDHDQQAEEAQLAITPDDDRDDQFYGNQDEYETEQIDEYDQADFPEEDGANVQSGPGDNATSPADDGSSRADDLTDEGNSDLGAHHDVEDDLVDYDNIDVGPSQHDSNPTATTSDEARQTTPNKPSDDVDALLAITDRGPTEEDASHSTSATATLDGDEKDEIDYSDNEDNADSHNDDQAGLQSQQAASAAKLQVSVDDEITWESEDEGQRDVYAPKQSVQVSPTSGKRMRPISDDPESAREQKDVKRRRS